MPDAFLIGFDFGTERIGVAIANSVTGRARPLATVAARRSTCWTEIGALIAQWQPARLVVGVARHPDGAAHEMTARCEKFARQLEGRFRLPVERVDERYSSAVVENAKNKENARAEDAAVGAGRIDAAGAGGVDAAAAAVILQQWMDQAQ